MRHTMRVGSWMFVGLLGPGILFAESPPPSPSSSHSPALVLPCGIADPSGRTGYLASASGGIEAIDLDTGKVLWATNEAQRPILVVNQHLLAQAGVKRNRLRILRFDLTRNGECDLESDPVVFPGWVVTGEAHAHAFSAHWHLEKNQLVLDWEARAWYGGSAKPSAEQLTAARKHAGGIALIDLRSGQVEVRPAAKTAPDPPPPLPQHLEKKAIRWQGDAGPFHKVLALEEAEGQQRLVLHSWDRQSEKAQEPRVLLQGKCLLARATLDERFLWLRESSPSPDDKGSLTPVKSQAWRLYSAMTGEPIGSIPHEAGMHGLVVLGTRVLYLVPGSFQGPLNRPNVQPRTLKAIDLPSGKKLWERAVSGRFVAPSSP